jgi:hypothetical protein
MIRRLEVYDLSTRPSGEVSIYCEPEETEAA